MNAGSNAGETRQTGGVFRAKVSLYQSLKNSRKVYRCEYEVFEKSTGPAGLLRLKLESDTSVIFKLGG